MGERDVVYHVRVPAATLYSVKPSNVGTEAARAGSRKFCFLYGGGGIPGWFESLEGRSLVRGSLLIK